LSVGRLTRAKDNSAPNASKNSWVIPEVLGDPRSTLTQLRGFGG
jgi:hypothetical protein